MAKTSMALKRITAAPKRKNKMRKMTLLSMHTLETVTILTKSKATRSQSCSCPRKTQKERLLISHRIPRLVHAHLLMSSPVSGALAASLVIKRAVKHCQSPSMRAHSEARRLKIRHSYSCKAKSSLVLASMKSQFVCLEQKDLHCQSKDLSAA